MKYIKETMYMKKCIVLYYKTRPFLCAIKSYRIIGITEL